MLEHSPLDEVRRAEAEVTRRVAAAHRAVEAAVQEAQAQSEGIKHHAFEIGQREGQAQYHEDISRAQDEAHALVAQAQRRAGT